jgi:acetyltransferase-like isoleucine patch superfamily enzyme
MAANILVKARFKVISFKSTLRKACYIMQGMIVGSQTIVGKIHVEWPNSVEIGKNCDIQDGITFWIQSPFKIDNRIIIGDNVFIGRNTEFNCCKSIRIGNNCLIASSTVFVDSSHTFVKDELITNQRLALKEITVEEDVWIGTGCKILFGIRLGRGCIIGAGAVVNKSVPPYEIWAGIPARKIGERKPNFSDKGVN